MNNSNSTIAAVATAVAPGEGSVAIVRISGPQAETIGKQLFVCAGHQEWGKPSGALWPCGGTKQWRTHR